MSGLTNALAFFKGNFLVAILSFFVLLGFILPPRSRKRRYGNHRRRNPARRKSGSTANPGKRRKRKKLPRAVGRIAGDSKFGMYSTAKNTRRLRKEGILRTPKPAFMVKGSKAAKDHMATLRAMRKKK